MSYNDGDIQLGDFVLWSSSGNDKDRAKYDMQWLDRVVGREGDILEVEDYKKKYKVPVASVLDHIPMNRKRSVDSSALPLELTHVQALDSNGHVIFKTKLDTPAVLHRAGDEVSITCTYKLT